MASTRQNKVSKLIQKELGAIFQQQSNFLFGGAFITVTDVIISPDLSIVKVYLSILNNEKAKIIKMVRTNTNPIRKDLGLKVRNQLRVVPSLSFFLDDSLDYVEKINQLLK